MGPVIHRNMLLIWAIAVSAYDQLPDDVVNHHVIPVSGRRRQIHHVIPVLPRCRQIHHVIPVPGRRRQIHHVIPTSPDDVVTNYVILTFWRCRHHHVIPTFRTTSSPTTSSQRLRTTSSFTTSSQSPATSSNHHIIPPAPAPLSLSNQPLSIYSFII